MSNCLLARQMASVALGLWLTACAPASDAPSGAGAAARAASFRNVGVAEFDTLRADPSAVVLDVRTPKEYAAGHLRGAVNLDWQAKDFESKVRALDPGKRYLLHCASGRRSAAASARLMEWGFTNVCNLQGGIRAWESAGKPTEK
jgi:rhodanese-related sulfurtransferase